MRRRHLCKKRDLAIKRSFAPQKRTIYRGLKFEMEFYKADRCF